ncbi:CapA family protein [Haloactinomyces albus]|uniref:Poly-gamma-glutamate synthesis protein (Capsule biosynthesis protein) n=1 Tax=Haloactinomyces albus TaxID=1352928 RepID=A0AAE3ZJY0_9ACTN|nr:CapA family protein [Haloactinomyces albus]MDR7304244.1 poly-gamma-glutamate synthesis protein (capsule biosynthesis protein) [Haloactinomyces albus]
MSGRVAIGGGGVKVASALVAALLILAGCSPPPEETMAGAGGPQAAPAPAAETGERERAESVRVIFTGDMLPNDELLARAKRYADGRGYDFLPMLGGMKSIISAADWAVCHQETPISADNSTISSYPQFSAPAQLAEAESAVGYDACSTASNHSVDYGATGVRSTLTALDRYGIRHTGTARSRTEARQPTIYNVQGLRLGHLSYTYGLNGLSKPEPWSVDLIDPERIRADARRADRAGADIVAVSMHWGTQMNKQPSAYQQRVADAVLRSPYIDLIVGHHAHVVQPIEQRADGQWVLYGLGNFLSQQDVSASDPNPPHRDGVIAEVTFTPATDDDWRISRVGYIPTFVDAPSDRVVSAPPFSRERTTKTLTSMGADLVDLTSEE